MYVYIDIVIQGRTHPIDRSTPSHPKISQQVADAERHTIYWYYALVAHAWQHMADILVEPANGIRPRLYFTEFPDWTFAEGWTTGRLMQVCVVDV